MENEDRDNTPALSQEAGIVAAASREQYEIQSAIFIAKKYPRNEGACLAKIEANFSRVAAADDATYSFPRGGKDIEGPSVDCARALARIWGNIRYGFRIVSVTDTMVHLKGYALDLESNAYVELEDEFKKLIQRKEYANGRPTGRTTWIIPDERDLRELINRHGAVLERNCVLKILPSDIVDQAVTIARITLEKAEKGNLATHREDTIRAVVSAFHKMGISIELLEQKLGHPVAMLNEKEVVELRGIRKSILDGHTQIHEHFAVKKPVEDDDGAEASKTLTQQALKETEAARATVGKAKQVRSQENLL